MKSNFLLYTSWTVISTTSGKLMLTSTTFDGKIPTHLYCLNFVLNIGKKICICPNLMDYYWFFFFYTYDFDIFLFTHRSMHITCWLLQISETSYWTIFCHSMYNISNSESKFPTRKLKGSFSIFNGKVCTFFFFYVFVFFSFLFPSNIKVYSFLLIS